MRPEPGQSGSARALVVVLLAALFAALALFLVLDDPGAGAGAQAGGRAAAREAAGGDTAPALAAQDAADAATVRAEEVAADEPPSPAEEDASSAPPPDATGIRGRLIGRDGRPLAGAVVEARRRLSRDKARELGVPLLPGEMHTWQTTTSASDDDGRFLLLGVAGEGRYELLARCDDDGLIGPKVHVETFDKAVMDVGDIAMLQGARVSGVVRVAGGRPVAGARISIGEEWEVNKITSGADGRFDTGLLYPSKRRVRLEARGYALPEQVEIELVEGDDVDDLVLEVVESAPISGRAVDEAGRGVAEAQIYLYDPKARWGGVNQDAHSSDDGSFEFLSLPPGEYTIYAQKPGFEYAELENIVAGGAPVELKMSRIALIEGIVLDARTGLQVKPKEVQLYFIPPWVKSRGDEAFQRFWDGDAVEIGDDGGFRAGLNQEGTFKVQAAAPGYAAAFSEPFELKTDSHLRDIVVRLEPAQALVISVLDQETREPVPAAVVDVFKAAQQGGGNAAAIHQLGYFGDFGEITAGGAGKRGARQAHVATDPAGTARIDWLGAGVYEVEVKRRDYALGRIAEVTIPLGAAPAPVEILLGHGGAIAGRVTNQRGAAETALVVQAAGAEGAGGSAVSGEDGGYLIENLRPGRYRISAQLGADKEEQAAILFGGDAGNGTPGREIPEAERFPLVVGDGATLTHDFIIERIEPGALSGVVLVNGAPASDAQILLAPEQQNGQGFRMAWNNRTRCDERGQFRFKRLKPGRYTPVLQQPSSNFIAGAVEVLAGADLRQVIEVTTGSLFGVVMAEGKPIAGAGLRMQPENPAAVNNWFGSSKFVRTEADGSFLVENVQSGSYKVRVTAEDCMSRELTGVTVAGRARSGPLEVEMTPGGWITAVLENIPAERPNVRIALHDAAGNVLTRRWQRPDDAGRIKLEVGREATGVLEVEMTDNVTGAVRRGSVAVALRANENLEVAVPLGVY